MKVKRTDGVFGSTVIHWPAVGVCELQKPFLVLYLFRVAYDFIPAKSTMLRAEAHILCIKLSFYDFILIQMYVLHFMFYLIICKDIIWVFNSYFCPCFSLCTFLKDQMGYSFGCCHIYLYSEIPWAKSRHRKLEFWVSDTWKHSTHRFLMGFKFVHFWVHKFVALINF